MTIELTPDLLVVDEELLPDLPASQEDRTDPDAFRAEVIGPPREFVFHDAWHPDLPSDTGARYWILFELRHIREHLPAGYAREHLDLALFALEDEAEPK